MDGIFAVVDQGVARAVTLSKLPDLGLVLSCVPGTCLVLGPNVVDWSEAILRFERYGSNRAIVLLKDTYGFVQQSLVLKSLWVTWLLGQLALVASGSSLLARLNLDWSYSIV